MRPAPAAVTPGQLLQLIIDRPGLTRGDLLDLTGVSRTTLLSRLDALVGLDLLVEELGGGTGRPGRPAGRLRVKDVERTVLVAELGPARALLAVTTAAGEELARQTYDHDIAAGPRAVLAQVLDHWEQLLVDAGREPSSLCGMGLALPAPVSVTTGRVVRSVSLAGWNDVDLAALLQTRWPVPVRVDNDANVMAAGEVRLNRPDAHCSLLVKAGVGLGVGLVVDGTLHHGHSSLEGEIEHLRVPGSELVCECGVTGCLWAVASGQALVQRLRAQGVEVDDVDAVAALARAGDATVREQLHAAGVPLGQALAAGVALVNPERLVVGGELAHTDEVLTEAVREGLAQVLHPRLLEGLAISTSHHEGCAAVRGSLEMVRAAVFSAAAVDAALAG